MTKKDIAGTIADKTGLTVSETHTVVQQTLDAIVATLISDRRIELRGFGVFEVKRRRAHCGRNPRTGEKVLVPEKLVVKFKPGNEMESRIQTHAEKPTETRDAA